MNRLPTIILFFIGVVVVILFMATTLFLLLNNNRTRVVRNKETPRMDISVNKKTEIKKDTWKLFDEEANGVRVGVLPDFKYPSHWYTDSLAGGTAVNIVFTDGGGNVMKNVSNEVNFKKLVENDAFIKTQNNECKISIGYVGKDDQYLVRSYNTKTILSEREYCYLVLKELRGQVRLGYTYTYSDGKQIINEYIDPQYYFIVTWPEGEYRRIYRTLSEGLYADFCNKHRCDPDSDYGLVKTDTVCLQSSVLGKSNEEGKCTFRISATSLENKSLEELLVSWFKPPKGLSVEQLMKDRFEDGIYHWVDLTNGKWLYINTPAGPGGSIYYYHVDPQNEFVIMTKSELPLEKYRDDVELILGNIAFDSNNSLR